MDKTKSAVGVFDKYAAQYQAKFMDVGLYHDALDAFCNSISKPQASILELACGPGNITRYLLKKRPDFRILGTDLAPNMVALAAINNPTATFQLMDCRDIYLLETKFDAIMCGFCLPYLSKADSIKLIQDAVHVLNPQGIFYLSTMEDDYSKSGIKKGSGGDEIYMHYHQADYLTEAFESNGYRIIELRRQDYPTDDGTQTIDLMIIAQKN